MSNSTFPLSSLPGLFFEERETLHGEITQEGDTGTEFRLRRYSAPRYRYVFEAEWLRTSTSEFSTLQTFYNDHGGQTESFLLVDPVDGTTRRVRFDNVLALRKERRLPWYTTTVELVTVIA